MFKESIGIDETDVQLFNNTFQLGGFNQEKINFQIATVAESWKNKPQIS